MSNDSIQIQNTAENKTWFYRTHTYTHTHRHIDICGRGEGGLTRWHMEFYAKNLHRYCTDPILCVRLLCLPEFYDLGEKRFLTDILTINITQTKICFFLHKKLIFLKTLHLWEMLRGEMCISRNCINGCTVLYIFLYLPFTMHILYKVYNVRICKLYKHILKNSE
jgi:hypothetical protein